MTDKTNNTTDNRPCYRHPEAKVVFIKTWGLLCESGNDSMREMNYGNGGFSEK